MEKPLYSIVAQRGLVESVDTDNAAAYVAVDAAVAATVLTMRTTSIFETEDGSGQISIAGIVYAYSAVDPDAFTLTLSSGLLRAVEDGDPVEAYPAAPTTTAAISLDTGEAITARVAAAHLIFLKSGQRLGVDREVVDVYKDGDDYVTLDVHNTRVQVTPEANPDLHEITNLCSDPKPADYLNWVGGAGGGIGSFGAFAEADSTYAALGLYLHFYSGDAASSGKFAPNGNSFVVDPSDPLGANLGYLGTSAKTYRFTGDLDVSVKHYAPTTNSQVAMLVHCYDAVGAYLGSNALGVDPYSQDYTLGTFSTYSARVDFATVLAAKPTVDSVLLVFTYFVDTVAYVPVDSYAGSCMVTAAGTLPEGSNVFRSPDSVGAVVNDDGSITAVVDFGAMPEWSDIANKPTTFPGAEGATGPAGPTGPQGAPSPMVWVVDDVTAEGIPLAAIPNEQFLLDMATGDFFQIYQT